MTTYTSTLPQEVLDQLAIMAAKLNVPKNKIIQTALTRFLEQIERQMYIESYQKLAGDKEILAIAEEGLDDYLIQLDAWDEKG